MKTKVFLKCISCFFIITFLLCPLSNIMFAEGSDTVMIPQKTYVLFGHTYKFFYGRASWEEAQKFCESLGGHLATINSENEWNFLRREARELGGNYWLGAKYANETADWKWITGEAWEYTAWSNEGQNPNENAKYLYVSESRGHLWYNWNNEFLKEGKYGFICEWDFESKDNNKVVIPQDTYFFGNHHYMFLPFAMTWSEAKAFCEDFGGHLATVTSEEEWKFLQEKARANTGHFWLGGSTEHFEGEWKWITGESWEFTAWSVDYPNSEGDADYLYISSSRDYMWCNWNNYLDNDTEGFICEWDYACVSDNGYYEEHSWSEWEVLSEGSCISVGEKVRTCSCCGVMETVTNDQGAHEYGEMVIISGSKLIPPIVKERKCVLCGYVDQANDWSYIWVSILAGLCAVGVVIGLISYIKAFGKS